MRRRRRTPIIIAIISFVLVGAGVYLLLSGARELIFPWWHQREAAKVFPPPAPPAQKTPLVPPRLDHRLFHRGDTLAQLTIPRLKGEWYVVEGSDEKDLRLGPGHLEGTVFPGEKGNCVIAGHRDTQFRVLKDIHKGDEILLRTSIGENRYRVTGWDIVLPTDTRSLMPTSSGVLNLVTCYPFYYVGNAPKRFIVHAELLGPEVASGQ